VTIDHSPQGIQKVEFLPPKDSEVIRFPPSHARLTTAEPRFVNSVDIVSALIHVKYNNEELNTFLS
jgi:hypothetical protein